MSAATDAARAAYIEAAAKVQRITDRMGDLSDAPRADQDAFYAALDAALDANAALDAEIEQDKYDEAIAWGAV